MKTILTRKQQIVLDFLTNNQNLFPHPPTLDELCHQLNLKSRGSLHKHIKALIIAGFVEPMNGHRRGVHLTDLNPSTKKDFELPMQGKIAAGKPIEALPQQDFIEVPRYLCSGSNNYVLQVEGESMIEAGILDGDWVVISPCNQASNGEIVVALVEQSEVTLKKIEQKPKKIVLHPANRKLKAMTYHPDQVTIQGKLVGLIRRF